MTEKKQPRDFDEWRLLALRDPEGFEQTRRKVLEAVIAHAPERNRQRLEALQWRLDRLRERSATPLAACISLSDMMWESLAGENGLLEALQGGREHNHGASGNNHKVITLRTEANQKHDNHLP